MLWKNEVCVRCSKHTAEDELSYWRIPSVSYLGQFLHAILVILRFVSIVFIEFYGHQ